MLLDHHRTDAVTLFVRASIALAFVAVATFVNSATVVAQESDSGQSANDAKSSRYIDLLKRSKASIKKSIDKTTTKPTSATSNSLKESILEIYDYYIEDAEDIVSEGGEFGKSEYDAARKAIQNETMKSTERLIQGLQANTSEINEIRRRSTDRMREAQQKYEDAMETSRREFENTTAAADLKFKFTVNRGDLGVVVWNLPIDKSLHSRSTATINLRLFLGSKVVWNRKGIRLNRKHARTPIKTARVMFDRVEIDVPKWNGNGGGLAEVEVYIGDENIALGKPCKVTSIETLPMHLDDQDAVTDGIREPFREGEGYWIPEAETAATVTIDLLGSRNASRLSTPKAINAAR